MTPPPRVRASAGNLRWRVHLRDFGANPPVLARALVLGAQIPILAIRLRSSGVVRGVKVASTSAKSRSTCECGLRSVRSSKQVPG
jgi:hypothetical protein